MTKHLSNFTKVKRFHEAFNCPQDQSKPSLELIQLRRKLIEEEFNEVKEALNNLTWVSELEPKKLPMAMVALFKELEDLLAVTYGTGDAFGLPMDEGFNRVHGSNMSKLGEDGKPIYREDGKVLKGPNYKEAELFDLIEKNYLTK